MAKHASRSLAVFGLVVCWALVGHGSLSAAAGWKAGTARAARQRLEKAP